MTMVISSKNGCYRINPVTEEQIDMVNKLIEIGLIDLKETNVDYVLDN